ncbi:hypothetical protein [Nocardioides pantholopis]|uniref:hypothetical protein n=1 Tax=Nocardioides pantholopis TaxID=2483798 RepID=UPI000FD922F7|nr:hypothetical protein [Nocardioides pantholopis]
METSRSAPLLLVTMSAFQAALAAGAPWGRVSYGGRWEGRLPTPLRVTSGVASLGYAASAAALASPRTSSRVRRRVGRGCVAVGAIGTVVNAISPSPPERLWSVWSVALAASSWHELARGRGDTTS